MNLISECWIPVRRADGSRQRITPWQLTDGVSDNPILAVASPRPDFDGALTQFFIGLLQTTIQILVAHNQKHVDATDIVIGMLAFVLLEGIPQF